MGGQRALVSRTSPGLQHGNKLMLRRLTVDILIDKTAGDDGLTDSFRLVSSEGAYRRKLTRSQVIDYDAQHWVLRFEKPLPDRDYSLFHVLGAEVEAEVFRDIPFASLDVHGPGTPEPAARNAEKREPEHEPEIASGIAVVMDEAGDNDVAVAYRPDPHLDVLAIA
jgi:hypothetical protein